MVADEVEQILAFGIPLKDKEKNKWSIGHKFIIYLGTLCIFGPKKNVEELKKTSQTEQNFCDLGLRRKALDLNDYYSDNNSFDSYKEILYIQY